MDEDDSESSGEEEEDARRPKSARVAGGACEAAGAGPFPLEPGRAFREDPRYDYKAVKGTLHADLASILSSGRNCQAEGGKSVTTTPFKLYDGHLKKDDTIKVMRNGDETPPEQRQSLSRAGSQDEDELFNVGCNHTASEMWSSLGDSRPSEYHLHVMGYEDPQPWALHPYNDPMLHVPKAPTPSRSCKEAERFLLSDPADEAAGEPMATDCGSSSRGTSVCS